ncbi:unnamed protein product, partial [marine sediment metagenome]
HNKYAPGGQADNLLALFVRLPVSGSKMDITTPGGQAGGQANIY